MEIPNFRRGDASDIDNGRGRLQPFEIASTPTWPSLPRDRRLDFLRGLLLVLMVCNHLPNPLNRVTVEPLGFVSSAEGFVLLAAYLAGIIYQRHLEQHGWALTRTKAWRKAGQLYLGHLALLAGGLALALWLGPEENPLSNIFRLFHERPAAALSAVVLLYQPPLFDILPIYAVGLAATPWVLRQASRHGWAGLLGLSAALWLAAQFGLRELAEQRVARLLPVYGGAFDPFAWQGLWVAGLALGRWRWSRQRSGRGWHISPAVAVPALLGTLAFLAIRHHWLEAAGVWEHFHVLLDKWSLAPLRLLNLACLTVGLVACGPREVRPALLEPLALLGRHSLPVFLWQIVLALVGLAWIVGYELTGGRAAAVAVTAIAALYLPALWLERFDPRDSRDPVLTRLAVGSVPRHAGD